MWRRLLEIYFQLIWEFVESLMEFGDGKGLDGKGHDRKGYDGKGYDGKGHEAKGHEDRAHEAKAIMENRV